MTDQRKIEAQLEESKKRVLSSQAVVLGEAIAASLEKGLSTQALAKLFRLDHGTVKARLIDCPPKGTNEKARSVSGLVMYYDLATAAEYLVTPKLTPEQILKHIQTADLPPQFQKTFWDANLAKQRYEESAGQLWRTEKVQELLGTTFQTLKFTIQLWMDTIETESQVTSKQREIIQRLVDGLQQEMYDAMIDLAAKSRTGPVIEEMQEKLPEEVRVDKKRARRDFI